ncbi:MAG: DNA/RNA non-specific endonuclease, partial [Gaiellales bacterium]
AVNMDGSRTVIIKRTPDKWSYDGRVSIEAQLGEELYEDNDLDRGHLVRREDPNWGTEEEAQIANGDTFHFTNCSPQHEIFNQAKKARQEDLLLWGNIEEHIAAQGKTMGQRLTVFNGPVFRSTDRPHRGLPVPKEFWKVVVYRQAGKKRRLRALAFILSQEGLIANLPLEEFEVGPYRPFQVRVREIEARTKLDFGDLSSADPLKDEGSDEHFEARSDSVLLTSLDDIVL